MFLRIISIVSVISIGVLMAEQPQNQGLEKMKNRAVEKLDKEIKILNNAKNCVSSATSKEEFRACREKTKIDLKAAREEARKDTK